MKKNLELLFTDAIFLNNEFFFKPEQQWSCMLGFYISHQYDYEHFAGIKTENDLLMNVFIPENTFYLKYKIYNHKYIENETLDVFWKDAFYAWSFNKEKYNHLSDRYFITRGKIIKQTNSHILLKIEKAIKFSNRQKDSYEKYKLVSIPKSYVFAINNIKAELVETKFYVDIRVRKEIESLTIKKEKLVKENDSMLSGIIYNDEKLKKNIFSIIYFFQSKKFSMKYMGNIKNKKLLEKYFLSN